MKKIETTYLEQVSNVEKLRSLSINELPEYCAELRDFIINSVAENPGHLGSSLGAIELAVALHYVYNTPEDRLIWDVGHQAYAHKIITGRKDKFHTNRKKNGISGFPKRSESPFDCFGGGHASVSISAAVGMAQANKITKDKRKVVAVIGDGALTGGLAFEGLINAGDGDLLVILNDNNISIDKGVGRLSVYLTNLTVSPGYNRFKTALWKIIGMWPWLLKQVKKIGNGAKAFFMKNSNLFESLGFRYFGPVDGNDVKGLVKRLTDLRKIGGPKLLHIITVKGKGYQAAELDQINWHAPGKFNPKTAQKEPISSNLKYQDIFGQTLLELAKQNPKIVAITPAMPSGSGLNPMMEELPKRTFDVGIAEGHAVTFAGGLASEGLLPYCSIYSSFAQRAIDNIIHDVVLQELKVILCLDRAGIVGEDGATHHGLYDIAMLNPIPNTIIVAPSNGKQLRNILYTAALCKEEKKCFAIRYPRGGNFDKKILTEKMVEMEIGKSEVIKEGTNSKVAILSLGNTLNIAKKAAQEIDATHIDLIFAKPLDTEMLENVAKKYTKIITTEDGTINGGVGSAIRDFYAQKNINIMVKSIGVDNNILEHGKVEELWEETGLTVENIVKTAKEL